MGIPRPSSCPVSLLSRAAADLAVRAEVESTLAALLRDVEHAHDLARSLRAHNALHLCREELAALRVRYDDREAAWVADRKEKERLGASFLAEVVELSAREVRGEARTVERQHPDSEREKSEEEETCDPRLPQQQRKEDVPVGGDKDTAAASKSASPKNAESNSSVSPEPTAQTPNLQMQAQGESRALPNAAGAAEGKPTTHNVDSGNQAFAPHHLNETTLMTVFAYLDPLDVMNFAQANKALLAKVNVMFGTGGDEPRADREDTSSSGGAAAAASPDAPRPPPPRPPPPPAAETQHVASPSPPAKSPGPGGAGAAGPTHRRSASGASAATAGSGGSAHPFSAVSSWFGGADAAAASGSAAAAGAKTAPPAPAAEAGAEIKLNAAMANSMALKLTPAELSVIVQMRKNLQRCEADARRWRLEKEDAVANLANVEAVKEFLVTKVRDTERTVQSQKEEMKRVEKKNLEDQEVIVFLDEKVKELEKACAEMKSREASRKKEHTDIVHKHEQKSRVLADMLAFEREQTAANEKEWKAAKKVLVKEVKHCRARIVALEAEGNGYRQQNTQLKSGLIGLRHHSGGSPSGGKKYYRSSGWH